MTLFRAYFDASGHPDAVGSSPALFVSGFVSTERKWLRFEEDWLALLNEFSILPPFHMTEFESGYGQYRPWKEDNERRDLFRFKALGIIKRSTNKPFSAGVTIPDLQRLFREYIMPADVPPEPYPFCSLQAIDLVRCWADHCVKDGRLRQTDKIQIVFERGDKHQGLLEKALDKRHLLPVFMKKDEAIPFQACDFLAWQHRRWLTDRGSLGAAGYRPRKSLIEFTRMFPGDSGTFGTWEGFVRECEERGIPKREEMLNLRGFAS